MLLKKDQCGQQKNHNVVYKHHYIANLLKSSDTAGIQELKSCSPEFIMTLDTTSSEMAGIQDLQS